MNKDVAEVSQVYQVVAAEQGVPVGYKQTEVGVIPDDWDDNCVGEFVAALDAGVSVNSLDQLDVFGHGKYILKTSCVDKGYFYASEVKSIVPQDISRAKCSPIKGAIIVSRMNTPALVGELGYVPKSLPNVFLPDRLWQMKFKNNINLNSRWLAYILSFQPIAQKIKESATGTSGSMKNISKNNILALRIPVPPEQEQIAIANALSDVDALLSELEKLIAKKQAIKIATMQQLLTGRTRLPQFAQHQDGSPKGYKQSELGEIPDDWETLSFGELAKPSTSRVNPKLYGGGDFCVELEHVAQEQGCLVGHTRTTGESSLKSVFTEGDVLFGKLRAYLRKYWLATQSGVCSTEIWVLKAEIQKSVSGYVFYLVQTEKFIEAASVSVKLVVRYFKRLVSSFPALRSSLFPG